MRKLKINKMSFDEKTINPLDELIMDPFIANYEDPEEFDEDEDDDDDFQGMDEDESGDNNDEENEEEDEYGKW